MSDTKMNSFARFIINYVIPISLIVVILAIYFGSSDSIKSNSVKITIQNISEEEVTRLVARVLDEDFIKSVENKHPQYKDALHERILLKIKRNTDVITDRSETVIQLGFKYRSSENLADDAKSISYLLGKRAEAIIYKQSGEE